MKKGTLLAILLFVITITTACHSHEWIDATCTEPKTCSKCDETEGESLGHKWINATCVKPKTCSICGETSGKAFGHKWENATCVKPKTCSICNEIDGDALGHTSGKWVVMKEATLIQDGEKRINCTECGETLESKAYSLSNEDIKKMIGDDAYEYYKDYVLSPNSFKFYSEDKSMPTIDSAVRDVELYKKDNGQYVYLSENSLSYIGYYTVLKLCGFELGEPTDISDNWVAYPIRKNYLLVAVMAMADSSDGVVAIIEF